MLSKKIHSFIYLIGLSLIAFFMPLSEFFTSFFQFLIITNFLLELDFKRKFQKLKQNKSIIIFLLLFLIPLIWSFNSENIAYALKDIKIKLPLLALPVIIGMSDALPRKKTDIILLFFISGVFISTFIGILAYHGLIMDIDISNIRNISVFINLLRLSLMICLSVFILSYWLYKKSIRNKALIILSIILILWFLYFLTLTESFTGIVSLVIITFLILLFLAIEETNKRKKITYWLIAILVPLGSLSYLAMEIRNFYRPTGVQNFSSHTEKGNPYTSDTTSFIVENGNYVFRDISDIELEQEWPKRSDLDIRGTDKNGQYLRFTILKYMTSKGLTKDAQGIAQLTDEDIRNIENGESNYKYAGKNGIKSRIYSIILGIDTYFKTGDPSGYSVAQRIEYHKMGAEIFARNFWLGTGTGDINDAYQSLYEETNSVLDPMYRHRAHNQFLTFFISFGIFGGILCLFAWFYPAVINFNFKNYYFIVYFLIATLSMFSDDTLETSAGVAFISFFYSLFLWGKDKVEQI